MPKTTNYVKSKHSRGDLVSLGKILLEQGDKLPSDTRPVLLRDNFDTLDTTKWNKSGEVKTADGVLTIETDGHIISRDDDKNIAKTYEYGTLVFNAKLKSDSQMGFTDGSSYVRINGTSFETYNAATNQSQTTTIALDTTNYHTFSIFWTPDWVRLEIDNTESCTHTVGMPAVPMYVKFKAGATYDVLLDAVSLFPMGQISGLEQGFLRMTGKFVEESWIITYLFTYPPNLTPQTDDAQSEPACDGNYIWYAYQHHVGAVYVSKIGRYNFDGTAYDEAWLASSTFFEDTILGTEYLPTAVTYGHSSPRFYFYDAKNDKFWYWDDAASGALATTPDGSFANPTAEIPASLCAFSSAVWFVDDWVNNDTTIYCINIDTEVEDTDLRFTHQGTSPRGIAYIAATKEIVIFDGGDKRLYYYDASDPDQIKYVRRSIPLGISTASHITAAADATKTLFQHIYDDTEVYRLDTPQQVAILVDPLPEMWSNWATLLSSVDLLSALFTSTLTVDTEITIGEADVTIADVDSLLYGWDSGAAAWEKIYTDGSNRLLVAGQYYSQITILLSQFGLSNADLWLSQTTQLLSQFDLTNVDAQLLSVVGQLSDVSLALSNSQLLLSQFDLSQTDALLGSIWTELHGTINDDLLDILSTIDQCCLATFYSLTNTDSPLYKCVLHLSDIALYVDQLEGYGLSQVGQLSDLSLAISNAQLLLSQFSLTSADTLLQSAVDLLSQTYPYIYGINWKTSTVAQLLSQFDLTTVDALLQSGVDLLSNLGVGVTIEALPTASDADMAIGAITVGSTVTFIASVATSGVLLIINDLQASTPDVVYLGSGGVATNTGVPLTDGRSITFENIIGGIYGICDVGITQQVRYMKFSNT